MALAAHTRVGPYEILDLLGTGGMGEVYRARDIRLKRDVAIKVLPDSVSRDAQVIERFEREAQVLASLAHPNIASIYGLEESAGFRALVMEVVEGPTLADRILRGALPLDEALPIARQIAEALEYAHERGVIHRDLKPANIKLTPDGSVKVLDFGLAKALTGDGWAADISSSPTVTAVATRGGIIVGTPGYMSPEQARGRSVDRRADIWSFGCVLFEMLTGRPTFPGDTVSDVLAAVLTQEPDFAALPTSTPAAIARLLQRCVQKDPKKRLQAIGDARIEIDDAVTGKDLPAPSPMPARKSRRSALVVAAVLVLLLVAVAIASWLRWGKTTTTTWTGDMLGAPAVSMGARVSPDGHTLAFQAMINGVTQVAISSPDNGSWTVLTHDGDHGFVNEISWAPDGSKIYYDRTIAVPAGIYSVPAVGGGERLVLENAGSPEALRDGSLVVIRPDTGGGPWRLYHYWPDSQRLDALPGWLKIETNTPLRVLPNGSGVVFSGSTTATGDRHLYLLDLATGQPRRIDGQLPTQRNNEGFPIAPTPDSRAVLVEVASGDLHRVVRVPCDGTGPIQTVLTLTEAPWYMDLSPDGTLYLDQVVRPHEILRFSPAGGAAPEVLASSDTHVAAGPYMAPVQVSDGRYLLDVGFSGHERLVIGKPGADFVPLLDTSEATSSPAVALADDEVALVIGQGANSAIGIASAREGRLLRRMQSTTGKNVTGIAASPDSRTLYFSSDGRIWSVPVTDGVPHQVTSGDNVAVFPDGEHLLVTRNQWASPTVVKVSLDGREQPFQLDPAWSIAPVPLGTAAVDAKGRVLIAISPPNSWFFRTSVVDPATGRVTPINLPYAGDTLTANWTGDGHILSVGLPLRSHLWRFRAANP